MNKSRPLFVMAVLAGSHLLLAAQANAATAVTIAPAARAVGAPAQAGCTGAVAPASGYFTASTGTDRPISKSAAILGGKVSRLEMIARQQAGLAVTSPASEPGGEALPGAGLAPAAGGISCASLAATRLQAISQTVGLRKPQQGTDDFLDSRRLSVRKTSFDGAWGRVRRAGLAASTTRQIEQATSGFSMAAKLAAVNAWANARIRYVEDRDLYGKADYWANAGTTLRNGAGDCEDIAIVKMQLLASMGVNRSDMYLTIARDLARNADHAMLVVRTGDGHWLLDNATNELLDASRSYDYRPILSFNTNNKWLHGY